MLLSMLLESLVERVEIKIEIESRLHCIDIYDDDCILKYSKYPSLRLGTKVYLITYLLNILPFSLCICSKAQEAEICKH